jgi:hypothetical protein
VSEAGVEKTAPRQGARPGLNASAAIPRSVAFPQS